MLKYLFLFFISVVLLNAEDYKRVKFTGYDGLEVTAELYAGEDKEASFIIFFHRARWSKGEYREIAPKYLARGYNCLAVDQRSGDQINDVINETNYMAKRRKKKTDYLEAYKDMQAALIYVKTKFKPEKIIIWGSSYSASLVFRLAAEKHKSIDAIIAFSPGEYFTKLGQKEDYIQSFAKEVKCPVFMTSAADEEELCKNIFQAVPHDRKMYFLPEKGGFHGSEALWEEHQMSSKYWQEIDTFFDTYIK